MATSLEKRFYPLCNPSLHYPVPEHRREYLPQRRPFHEERDRGLYDLKGFFMSINRAMVTDKLCRFIRERYKCADVETLVYLTQVTLLNSPARVSVR